MSQGEPRATPQGPSVPNPCSVCGIHIFGSFIGTGDGSVKDGGSFAHPECYWRQRAEDAEDDVRRLHKEKMDLLDEKLSAASETALMPQSYAKEVAESNVSHTSGGRTTSAARDTISDAGSLTVANMRAQRTVEDGADGPSAAPAAARTCPCGNPANYCTDCRDGDVSSALSATARTSSNVALVRQAIFHVLDEKERDFTDDEQRVDFADRVAEWLVHQG